jgi:hypothetical protein
VNRIVRGTSFLSLAANPGRQRAGAMLPSQPDVVQFQVVREHLARSLETLVSRTGEVFFYRMIAFAVLGKGRLLLVLILPAARWLRFPER